MDKTLLNQRFQAVIELLLAEDNNLTKGEIATKLDTKANNLSEILKGRQQPTIALLSKLFSEYNISKDYIFDGILPIKNTNTPAATPAFNAPTLVNKPIAHELKGGNVPENVTPTVPPKAEKQGKNIVLPYKNSANKGHVLTEPEVTYNLGTPKVITVNERNEENITFVPVKARAGYLTGYGDPEYISSLPSYRLPGLDNGTYRMFEVDGPSMSPNIISGDRVIGQWLSSTDEIRDNRVHIVVTREQGVVVKRVLNRVHQRGKIVLKSDTVNHRHEYPTYEILPESIMEIWYCRLKLSSDFSEPAEVYHRLADLESDMSEVKLILSSLEGKSSF